jgi:hypothetical protein
MAIPSGAPPGSTVVSAVEACVKPRAPRKDSCGSSVRHGSATVTTSKSAAPAIAAPQADVTVPSWCATLP